MLEHVGELSVFVSALIALAVGSIWYSPLVFGNHWQRAAGLGSDYLKTSRATTARYVLLGLCANILLMLMVHVLMTELVLTGIMGVASLVGILVCILAASLLAVAVAEGRGPFYFAIHAGYAVLVLLIGVLVMVYWPW